MTSKAIPEADILAPRDPALDNSSDDWPEFELKEVRVHKPRDPSQLTSLLDAAAHDPVTLTGHLEPLPRDQSHLQLQTTTKRAPLIELTGVRTFSYGQFEDGNIGLWAGGKAGWFALKPARAYKSIWNDMVESVKIFYWVVDAYREKRRKGKATLPDYTADKLFYKYADVVLKDLKGADEAAQVIYEQRSFLLASMLAGKESITWSKNPLYQHLSQRFPEDHAMIKARVIGHAPPARNARQTSASSETSNLKRKRGRPRKDDSQEPDSIREESVAEVLTKTEARGGNDAPQQHTSKLTASRRTLHRQESPSTDTSEPETRTPAHNNNDSIRKAMKGRSALRPKASKASKGATIGGKAPAHDFDDGSDEEDLAALSPTAAKRRQSQTAAQRISRLKQARESHNTHDVDEGIDIPSSPTSGDPLSTPSDTGVGALDNDSDDDEEEAPGTDLAVRLKHEPDPIQEDTWVCALDGCSHKVYQASQADSQRLIREHYALHAYDDDARVQLVKKLQHPSLPVGHLMERVRLQARTDGFPGSRSALEGANAHSRYRPQVRY